MIERIRQGDKRIPAAGWNAIADAVDAIDLSTGNSRVARNPTLIMVQNKSGDHVPAFGVLRIAGRVFDANADAIGQMLNDGVVVKGEKPDDDDDQVVCITQEPIPKDGVGRAVLWAATGIMINVTDKEHNYAKPINGDTKKLESTDYGPWRIIDKPTGTGEKFCYVCPAGGGGSGECRNWSEVRFRPGCQHPATVAGTVTYLSNPKIFTLDSLEAAKQYAQKRIQEFEGTHYQLVPDSIDIPTVCVGTPDEEETASGVYRGIIPGNLFLARVDFTDIDPPDEEGETGWSITNPRELYAVPCNDGDLIGLKAVEEIGDATKYWKILFVPVGRETPGDHPLVQVQ